MGLVLTGFIGELTMRLSEIISEHIVKLSDSKLQLFSKKANKNLGTYDSLSGAEKRERREQYFKHQNESASCGATSSGGVATMLASGNGESFFGGNPQTSIYAPKRN